MQGFTFNGIHSGDMKLQYAPNDKERGDLYPAFEVVSAERAWHHGGEWYQSRVKSREFELNCYYEFITTKELNAILRWLDRRNYADLVFDIRPYVAYKVRLSKEPTIKDYPVDSLHSGTMVIRFKCFSPFGRLLYTTSNDAPASASDEVDLLSAAMMPSYTSGASALVYNPGTEYGHSILTITGATTKDITITNETTGDVCKIYKSLPSVANSNYVIESKTARCYWHNTTTGEKLLDFAWHNFGYIRFAPNRKLISSVTASATNGSKTVTLSKSTTEDIIGAYIYLNGAWKKIANYNGDKTVTLSANANKTESISTMVVSLNKLSIANSSGISGSLSIACLPEVR